MKKISSITLLAMTAIAVMMGCSGNGKQQQKTNMEELNVSGIERDSTLYGICGLGTTMSTVELIMDSGDTIHVSIEQANDAGQVFGSFTPGDRLGVLPKNGHKDTARVVINITTLMGDWVMPNPLDGASHMGFSIKEGGIMDGIEQSSIIYKTWKLYNGKLEMVTQREGGSEEEEAILYNLLILSNDTLVIRDTEDTFNYGRIHEEHHKRNIHFEETNDEEFRL